MASFNELGVIEFEPDSKKGDFLQRLVLEIAAEALELPAWLSQFRLLRFLALISARSPDTGPRRQTVWKTHPMI